MLHLRDAYVVLGGSLPRGLAPDAYRVIIRYVQRRGARAILDADGPCLSEGLKAHPFAVKPNLNELRRVTGRALSSDSEVLQAATGLSRGGVKIVMVSLGRDGLLVVSRSESFRARPPQVTVKSTVGAGDSTVAGFVFLHAAGKALEACVRFATACGTAATLAPGNQLCRLRDVQRLLPRVQIDRLGKGSGVRGQGLGVEPKQKEKGKGKE